MGVRPLSSVTPSAPPALHIPRINRPRADSHATTIAAPMFDSPAGFSGAYSIPNSERPTSVFSDSEIKSPPLQEWAIPIDDDTVVRNLLDQL
jgi:hypothetical protein